MIIKYKLSIKLTLIIKYKLIIKLVILRASIIAYIKVKYH